MNNPQPSSQAGRTAWARNLGAPVRDFLAAETGGAIVLVAGVVVALAWANSPWGRSYGSFWTTRLAISLGHHTFARSLREWVDEGLMAMFFLVIGLEAKRELDLGELRNRNRIGVPVVAAIGGMGTAVAVYLAINAGSSAAGGWGVPMSTDTALALGSLALVGPRGSTRLRVFLLTLSVIDDLVALIVIAVAYTHHVAVVALAVAIGLFGVLVALRYVTRWRGYAAVVVGIGIWVALWESGIDPVIAGLAFGLVTSAYPPARDDLERVTELTRTFREQPTPELARSAQRGLSSALSLNDRLQYRLHPWTSFLIVPVFALANAGIAINTSMLGEAARSPVTIGIVLAYLLGKPLGIVTATLLGTRRARGAVRISVTWPGLAGTGVVAGVGFTVSLLIAGRAFTGGLLAQAKVGVLTAAILSPLLAWAVFQLIAHLPASVRARQLLRTADQIIDLADEVDPARDHIRGPLDAPVTLVEYGDFECPFCGQSESTIRELLTDFGEDLRYVFRHLPLTDVHPWAQPASEAAEAAAAQGSFWEMHDLLFSHQDELSPHALRGYAEQIGLDVVRFESELRRHVHAARVAVDVASADLSGVSGTPTFFINGRRHHGVYDIATLTAAVGVARSAALVSQYA